MNRIIRLTRKNMAFALLLACSSPPEPIVVAPAPGPINKSLIVQAGPNVNNYNDASNPVVIRLYQLASRTEFETIGFLDIFNNSSPELAGVVLNVQSLPPLYPSESRRVDIDLESGVFFLGVFAEFADFGTQQFKDVVPITREQLDNGVSISVTASGISLRVGSQAATQTPVEIESGPMEEERKPGFFERLLGRVST